MPKDEADITQERVWREHLQQVHPGRHWAYLAGVLLGAFLLMLALIALLGASAA
jgi:hypothetical protein